MLMRPVQTQVENVVAQLFDRLPSLMGFSLEEQEQELIVADVETFPWSGRADELLGEIAVPLLELMDEEPEARELLRGRTFARTLQ